MWVISGCLLFIAGRFRSFIVRCRPFKVVVGCFKSFLARCRLFQVVLVRFRSFLGLISTVEAVDSKDSLAQLEASKSSIKDLFKDLVNEIKDFKDQITVKTLLRKNKENGKIKCPPLYFNSTTKTVINFKYHLGKSSQEGL